MITLLILGILIFIVKVALVGVKAAWGLSKLLIAILCFPIVLLVLFFLGLIYVSLPLLIIALLVLFLRPVLRK